MYTALYDINKVKYISLLKLLKMSKLTFSSLIFTVSVPIKATEKGCSEYTCFF